MSEAPADRSLGPAAEREWKLLRAQLDLADGFWLGFLFTASVAVSRGYSGRVDRLLHARGRAVLAIDVEEPAAWREVLPALLAPSGAAAGCVWVSLLGVDSLPTGDDDGETGPWREAVGQLVARANERRQRLIRHLPGGLVIAVHPAMKPLVRDTAPDLWTYRSIVLDPDAAPLPVPAEPGPVRRGSNATSAARHTGPPRCRRSPRGANSGGGGCARRRGRWMSPGRGRPSKSRWARSSW